MPAGTTTHCAPGAALLKVPDATLFRRSSASFSIVPVELASLNTKVLKGSLKKIFFNPRPRICLLILQTEEQRERNLNVKEKHQLVASHMHLARIEPKT